jgi:hypothetical protein
MSMQRRGFHLLLERALLPGGAAFDARPNRVPAASSNDVILKSIVIRRNWAVYLELGAVFYEEEALP